MEKIYEVPIGHPKIILTGFKPFFGDSINPSEVICQSIQIKNVIIRVLSVDFNLAFLELKEIIESEQPDFLIMLGIANGRLQICLEKVALNWNESKYPDEAGNYVEPSPINPKKSDLALMTKFPINELQNYLDQKKHPVKMSFSAGTYVCNNLYYKVLSEFPELKALFIHVPSEKDLPMENHIEIVKEILKYLMN